MRAKQHVVATLYALLQMRLGYRPGYRAAAFDTWAGWHLIS